MNFPLAHLMTTGLGPVYDGIGYLLLSPADLVPVIGLALLAGLRGPQSGRWILFLMPLAWVCGGLAGLDSGHTEPAFPFQCISFMVIGALVASDLKLPAAAVAFIGIAMGAVHGFINGTAIHGTGAGPAILELIGTMTALFVLLAICSSLVISLRKDWMRIVVRVAGSWMVAIGLLLLGWTFRHGSV